MTRFVGREHVVAEVMSLLEMNRLVTLTGPGGVGKTRLALEVASHLQQHAAAAVVLVELGALTDPTLVLKSVAAALGILSSNPLAAARSAQ